MFALFVPGLLYTDNGAESALDTVYSLTYYTCALNTVLKCMLHPWADDVKTVVVQNVNGFQLN